ncbi:tyrosine-type recombinase/integrase [Paracandidimonas soli]|uniref:Phage integrase family protein n=3 Tax=Paracandidimonas soli TaxID=1917182 RepID=A0A4R3UYF6_9BURK|nr:phage integrase family protein [Paracandidimonas soli]
MNNRRHRRLQRTCPTLAEALERYLTEVSTKKKSGYQEQSIARAWKSTNLINRNISRITPHDLKRLRDEWLKDRKPATVNRRLALISHLYTIARKEWGIHWLANPVELVSRPTVSDARDRRIYTQIRLYGVPAHECPRDELEWIKRNTKSESLPTIITIAAQTCMRLSEIVLLKREDVDLTHGVITLHETKNGRTRYVPMTPFAKHALRQWLAGKPLRGRIFDIQPGSASRAFARARDRAKRAYIALCRKYGRRPITAYFTDLRFHDLRHESTSVMADIFGMHHLSKVNGNVDTKTLLRYYNPRGRDLVKILMSSQLAKWQIQQLRMAA